MNLSRPEVEAIAARLNALLAKCPATANDIYDLLTLQIVASPETDADPEIVTGYDEGSDGARLRFLGLLNGICYPHRIFAECTETPPLRVICFGVM